MAVFVVDSDCVNKWVFEGHWKQEKNKGMYIVFSLKYGKQMLYTKYDNAKKCSYKKVVLV